jgi:small-conductance mechanosensitive channel
MKVLIFIAIVSALIISIRFFNTLITRYGDNKGVSLYRVKYISKTINIALITFFTILLINVSGFEYSQISIFLSSVFAVIGVALFAQWSILSNITASLIIFFGFPYRVGDKIKVMDKDDDISGVIEEITLFHVLINREGELITYPNSLMLQKGVIKNPKSSSESQLEKTP